MKGKAQREPVKETKQSERTVVEGLRAKLESV